MSIIGRSLAPFESTQIRIAKNFIIEAPIISEVYENVAINSNINNEEIEGNVFPLLSECIDYEIAFFPGFHHFSTDPVPLFSPNEDRIGIKDYVNWDFASITISQPTLDLFIPKVDISENLFLEILKPKETIGMNYASRYIFIEQFDFDTGHTEKPRQRISPYPLQSTPGRTEKPNQKPRFKPSIWDLIFPILQPPLDFQSTDQLFLPHDLFRYQPKGVDFLINNHHALLADDMGTGKTVMTLVALKILFQQSKIKKGLILCPKSVLLEWRTHCEEWASELIFILVRGTTEIRKLQWNTPAHLYITTYDTLRADINSPNFDTNTFNLFDIVVVDEAHHLKNMHTERSRAVKKLQPTFRWALTGTPLQNNMDDLRSLFAFIYPQLITTSTLEMTIPGKIAPYFLRRRKSDVLPELPEKIRQNIWLELDEDQYAEYQEIEKGIQSEIRAMGNRVTKQHIFAKIQKLKQICNFSSMRATSPKLELLKEQLEDISKSGNKVIVFTQYIKEGIDKIIRGFNQNEYSKIDGKQSDSERTIEITRFKKINNVYMLVASIKSGGEGLNLTEASYVIHFDHWWNPAVMWQAEDRVHRSGQKRSVNIYSYWIKDTIDERIFRILGRKELLFQKVIDGLSENTIEEMFSIDDLLEIIGLGKRIITQPQFKPQDWKLLSNDQIVEKLLSIDPREFEQITNTLMHYLGYPNLKTTKQSGDGGIDVTSSYQTSSGVKYVVAQCKRYRGNVGVNVARELLGVLKDNPTIEKGIIATTGGFSSECIDFCSRNGIEMINGVRFAEYIKKFGISV